VTVTRRPLPATAAILTCVALAFAVSSCGIFNGDDGNTPIKDEAARAGRGPETLKAANEDYYADMDRGISHRPNEVLAALPFLKTPEKAVETFAIGRNNWIVWTAGNDTLWNFLSSHTFGSLDFLKTISTNPSLKYGRNKGKDGRWEYLGLVNEPCFEPATAGDPKRFGLWLDTRRTGGDCPPDPFENEQKYPGIKIGARGEDLRLSAEKKQLGWPERLPVGSYYGYPTGIVGLRLFPNPAFDAAAAAKWDPERFYSDRSYYAVKDLVRPYRVGMSCGFCHVGPDPIHPPADPENPKWENLTSNPGAQYFWVDRIFFFDRDRAPGNFAFQLFHTSLPGTLDTSLISSDNINNPRTMNAIYSLGARLQQAKRVGREKLGGGGMNNKQFNDYPETQVLTDLFTAPDTVLTPRVLKDGSDSVGALGALNRVYLNIGMASDEWTRHFMPLLGPSQKHGPVTPVEISVLRNVSSFWTANEAQTPALAAFFLASAKPDRLIDAPGGPAHLNASAPQLDRGKDVFAERCARCHSTKVPELPESVAGGNCAGGGNGSQYLDCWNKYWEHTKTGEFKEAMKAIVKQADFLQDNYLSSERRVPVTLLETNACSPLATNALKDNIWDNFSSQSYKDLPAVGPITVYSPIDGKPSQYEMPAGGRGYTRPASLISVWSTAPLLLNNSLGPFNSSPSVEARVASFDASIREMLWPERRKKDELVPSLPGYIQRTTARSTLGLPVGYLPAKLQELIGWKRFVPGFMAPTDVEIGPIPAGTPVGLLANLALISEDRTLPGRIDYQGKLISVLTKLIADLKSVPDNASDADIRKIFHDAVPPLMEISKCPDYVVNRGHYFGTDMFKQEPGLTDPDKEALIAFLKTF
jgi:hypothetical protein